MSNGKCPQRWFILAACSIASLFWSMNYTAYSPLLSIIKYELGLTYTEDGLIASSFFAGYAIGQIPWGYITDRVGGRKVITIGFIGASVASAMFGYSAIAFEIFIWRIFAGFMSAAIFVPGVKVLSDCFSRDERGLAVGIFSIIANLGFFATPPVVLAMEGVLGWRTSLSYLALISLVAVPAVWLWLRKAPRGEKTEGWVSDSGKIFRRPAFWALAYGHFIRLGLIFTLISWIPIFLQDSLNFSIVHAGLALSVMNGVAVFSGSTGGLLSKRLGDVPVVTIALLVLTPIIFIFGFTADVTIVWILILLIGLFSFLYMGPMWSLSARISPLGRVGVVSGYHNTFASVGALTLPFLFGYFKDSAGSFELGWIVISVLCALGVVAIKIQGTKMK